MNRSEILFHLSLCYTLLQIVPISPYYLGNLLLQGIEAIARTWESTELDITTYKDRGHFKVRLVCSIMTLTFKTLTLGYVDV